jgi:adenosylhomocysteine nucleosidase
MIGIIGAMDEEVALLRDRIEKPQSKIEGGFEYISGLLDGVPVALLRCGIGTVNAAVGTALLIYHYRPSLVINTGSAGGLDPSLRIGDAIIADGLLYHDVDVTGFDYAPGQIPGQKAVFKVNEMFIRVAEDAVFQLKTEGVLPEDFQHLRGVIGSGDVFMDDEKEIAHVKETFPAVKAVEMEGAAIAHACVLLKTPFLIIRAVSDIAGADSPVTFEEFLPVASRNSAELVRRIVKNVDVQYFG